ncbi:MAG: hypothetical protein ACT4P0_10175 [Panacagrimonas sp.]
MSWHWNWNPQLHFPWSGSVAQRIEPDTRWFFGAIPPGAGDGAIEKKAFEIASYGRQLGLLTEVLLDVAEREGALGGKAGDSLAKLRTIQAQIEQVKIADADELFQQIDGALRRLQSRDSAACADLKQRLRISLGDDPEANG